MIVAELEVGDVRTLEIDELEELQNCFKDKKILVLSFESKKSSEIYFKQLHESDLKAVRDAQQDESFNFASLLHRLNSQNFGKFNGKLLETFVDTQTCYDGKRLIDFAVESNKILSIRFLQLFNFDLRLRNELGDRPLEIAAKHSTMDAFIALLKFKFEFWNDELCKCDYNLLHLRDKRGFTLLMGAAEKGNSGVVSLLVKFGVDKNVEVSLRWADLHYRFGFSVLQVWILCIADFSIDALQTVSYLHYRLSNICITGFPVNFTQIHQFSSLPGSSRNSRHPRLEQLTLRHPPHSPQI